MRDVTFDQIKLSLGSLLFLWANIERSAREQVFRAHGAPPKPAHGMSAVLRDWKASVADAPGSLNKRLAFLLCEKLQPHLDVRNGLCHGLSGISASCGCASAALTWETDTDAFSITYEELEASFRWLAQVPRAISLISAPQFGPSERTIDSSENRDWWRVEFSLALPNI